MSKENVKNFIEMAANDDNIIAELKAIKTIENEVTAINALVELGKKYGYEFTVEELAQFNAQKNINELSEEQLNSIDGGGAGVYNRLLVGIIENIFGIFKNKL